MKSCTLRKRKNTIIFILIIFITLLSTVHASQKNNGHEKWLIERTGNYLPLDITVRDENGMERRLRELIDKPALFVFIYYSCHHICPQVLGGISDAVSKIPLTPGKDYEVVTMSFDPDDTPAEAISLKRNFIKAAGKSFPADSWKFLVGSEESIQRVADAIGFKFRRAYDGFIHPSVLMVLSPGGMISRYIYVEKFLYGVAYPVTFEPEEVAQALMAASGGKITAGGHPPLLFCFPHEPKKWGGFYNLLSVTGALTLLLIGILFLYLIRTSKGKR